VTYAVAVRDRRAAEALDADDPLGRFRDEFAIDDDTIYLAGNSLGRMPRRTASRVTELLKVEWARGLVGSWEHWIDLPSQVGDTIATLVGAEPGEVLVGDSTTINLYKLAVAALDARPDRTVIVADADDFPTDRYVLEGIAASRGIELRPFRADAVAGTGFDDVADALTSDVALLVMSHVDYRSAAIAPMNEITARAHDAGAVVLWDLSHSVGVVPVGLAAAGADLAVGCTYKYVNAGPGSPAFAFVRRQLQAEIRQPIWGWFGQRDQFAMADAYDPAAGIAQVQTGTPSVLSLVTAKAGAELIAEAGIDAIRAKSRALTALAVERFDTWLAPLGFELGSPRDPDRRGGHVTVCHPKAWALCAALIDRADVVPDYRAPDAIRLGFSPLYTRFVDVWDALDRLRDLAGSGPLPEPPPRRVT
jgi:kynureninase